MLLEMATRVQISSPGKLTLSSSNNNIYFLKNHNKAVGLQSVSSSTLKQFEINCDNKISIKIKGCLPTIENVFYVEQREQTK